MSDAMTTTGAQELRAAAVQLPTRVTEALRGVAERSATRMRADARARLLAGQKHPTGKTAALIEVVEDVPNKQYRVNSMSRAGTPANTVLWLEMGTVKQAGLHYMHDAAAAESESYRREGQAIADALATEAFG